MGKPARQPDEVGARWFRRHLDAERSAGLVRGGEDYGPGAVATSGVYERGPHLIDPHTGTTVTGLLSATVIGIDLAFADALATALYVSGGLLLDKLTRLAGYHGFVVYADGTIRTTRDLPVSLKFAA